MSSKPNSPNEQSNFGKVKVIVASGQWLTYWKRRLKRSIANQTFRKLLWLIGLMSLLAGMFCAFMMMNISPQLNWQPYWRTLENKLQLTQPLTQPSIATKKTVQKDITKLSLALKPKTIANKTQYLGHFPFAEANAEQLMTIGSYSAGEFEQRFEQLDWEAGLALMKMLDAARSEGIWIVPISGFRNFTRQEEIFQSQTEISGSAEVAALSVAPPGYSEHHTGLAIDLADGLARAADVSRSFGDTEAFKWLGQHATEFGFELSFPENNSQGVNYEPWHWRFVGSPKAIQTFSQAQTLPQNRAAEH